MNTKMLIVIKRIIHSAIAVDQTLAMNSKSVRENAENMEDNDKFYIIMLQDVNNQTVIIFEFISPQLLQIGFERPYIVDLTKSPNK
jgi:hypothetical protein